IDLVVYSTCKVTDLSQVIRGETDDIPIEVILIDLPSHKVSNNAFKEANENNLAAGWRAIRTNQYTYVIHKGYAPGDQTECLLYNLEEDPYQMNPKVITNPNKDAIAKQLHERLVDRLNESDDPFIPV